MLDKKIIRKKVGKYESVKNTDKFKEIKTADVAETEDALSEILRDFRAFKLNASWFKTEYTISKEALSDLSSNTEDKMIDRITKEFASKVINYHRNAINIVDNKFDVNITYDLNLMVFKREDFKTIIEAVIQGMTNEQIKIIKGNK